MCERVRKVGEPVMRPIGIELDDLHDPAEAIAEKPPLREAVRRARRSTTSAPQLP